MSSVRRGREARCAARMGRSFAAGRAAALNEAGDGAVSRIGCRVAAEQCSVSASPRVNASVGRRGGRWEREQIPRGDTIGFRWCGVCTSTRQGSACDQRVGWRVSRGGVVVVKEMVCFPLGSPWSGACGDLSEWKGWATSLQAPWPPAQGGVRPTWAVG